jgi:hypothetical protein
VCILCGEFVSRIHWTDRHVENKARASYGPAGNPGDYHRYRRRDRFHRSKVANEVVRHYGLRVADWSGSKYVLRDGKGRSELVQDLGALWPAAEKLVGRPLDPLDPDLHAALRAASDDALSANGG